MNHYLRSAKNQSTKIARFFGLDKRVAFNDLAIIRPGKRVGRTKVLNLYSAANNIGNFLPVLAIHEKLGIELDCWNIHDKSLDYDFVNRNYHSIIIGGAGLLHPVFERFWREFSENCNVPFIIWGVGGCYPDNMNLTLDSGTSGGGVLGRGVLHAFKKAELINVRDSLTAELVGQRNVSVTACPTLMLLKNYRLQRPESMHSGIVFAPHSGLLSQFENERLFGVLRRKFGNIYHTENEQSLRTGLWELIDIYKSSNLVVTSRLHGAITAWSLGVPFIALSRDKKMDGFAELAGLNDVIFRDLDQLLERLDNVPVFNNDLHYDATVKFADLALDWCNRL